MTKICPKTIGHKIYPTCFILFVCFFGVYRSTWEFITHMKTSPLRWRAANFDLCSALMAIEQWEVFNVPHPLRHGPTVHNDHLWGPVTLTPVAERLAVHGAVTICFYYLGLSRPGIEPRSHAYETNTLLYATAAVHVTYLFHKTFIRYDYCKIVWNLNSLS